MLDIIRYILTLPKNIESRKMNITVEKNNNKKVSHVEMLEAAEFMLNLLLPNSVLKNLNVEITHNKHDTMTSVHGYIDILDDRKYPRNFLVYIRPTLSRENQLKALAHEMTHVKQYSMRETLKIRTVRKKTNDAIYDEYYNTPDEIEAHGREVGLMTAWLREIERREESKPV